MADINACSSFPEALEKLKQIQSLSRREVEAELPDSMQCIEGVLQQATSGSVRNIPICLWTVSKVAKRYPPVLRALQSDAYRPTVSAMFRACAANKGMYRNARAVSQLCVAQYNLQVYCKEFWHSVSEKLGLELGVARDPLLRQVPRVAVVLAVEGGSQVRIGLDWLQGQGIESSEMQRAWEAIANNTS